MIGPHPVNRITGTTQAVGPNRFHLDVSTARVVIAPNPIRDYPKPTIAGPKYPAGGSIAEIGRVASRWRPGLSCTAAQRPAHAVSQSLAQQ